MKKTLKRITASILATATMAVGTVGICASAAGGWGTFTVNGVTVNKYIDVSKTAAGAISSCSASSCSYLYVSITAYHASTGSKFADDYVTRGYVSVSVTPDNGKIFSHGSSYHYAIINNVGGGSSMSASAGI